MNVRDAIQRSGDGRASAVVRLARGNYSVLQSWGCCSFHPSHDTRKRLRVRLRESGVQLLFPRLLLSSPFEDVSLPFRFIFWLVDVAASTTRVNGRKRKLFCFFSLLFGLPSSPCMQSRLLGEIRGLLHAFSPLSAMPCYFSWSIFVFFLPTFPPCGFADELVAFFASPRMPCYLSGSGTPFPERFQ